MHLAKQLVSHNFFVHVETMHDLKDTKYKPILTTTEKNQELLAVTHEIERAFNLLRDDFIENSTIYETLRKKENLVQKGRKRPEKKHAEKTNDKDRADFFMEGIIVRLIGLELSEYWVIHHQIKKELKYILFCLANYKTDCNLNQKFIYLTPITEVLKGRKTK